LLDEQCLIDEIKEEIKTSWKSMQKKKKEKRKTYRNLWDTAKAVLKESL
jgi:hypothetical protein